MPLVNRIRLQMDRQRGWWIILLGAVIGLAFFLFYYSMNLTTAHYDAKAHLLVARRIVDSLAPGYEQIGVNWLPLIHLIYLPFVVFDSQYRSGFLPSLVSVCSFALCGWLVYRISMRVTGSRNAGIFAAVILLANPNLEYLQSCPLTEPVYMLLLLLSVDSLIRWRESDPPLLPWLSAFWAALGALCRYEGWYFIGGLLLLLAYDFWSGYLPRRRALQAGIVYLGVFTVPAASHFAYIYFHLGDSFFHRVIRGNPAPYETYKHLLLSLFYHLGQLSQMAALIPLIGAAVGLLLFLSRRSGVQRWAPLLLLWIPSLINISALYWGLVYRLRYSVLLLPAVAIFSSFVVASDRARIRAFTAVSLVAMLLPWASWYFRGAWFLPGPGALLLPAAALVLFLDARVRERHEWSLLVLCVFAMQFPGLAREDRPMMKETLEHEFIEPERQQVLQYLRRNYDGGRILIDMGKLAPLIYDSKLPVREFVYNEGRDSLWHSAVRHPEQEVGWVCSQKGDSVSELVRVDPCWLHRYSLAVKTENLSLYRLRQ